MIVFITVLMRYMITCVLSMSRSWWELWCGAGFGFSQSVSLCSVLICQSMAFIVGVKAHRQPAYLSYHVPPICVHYCCYLNTLYVCDCFTNNMCIIIHKVRKPVCALHRISSASSRHSGLQAGRDWRDTGRDSLSPSAGFHLDFMPPSHWARILLHML